MILKRKLRYVLVESSRQIDTRDTSTRGLMEDALISFLGENAYTEMNPKILTQCSDQMFVFRVNRGSERQLLLALSFVKHLGNEKWGFYTISISGTVKSLLEKCG